MIIKKFVPLILGALFLFSSVQSQVKTNTEVLRAASVRAGGEYRDAHSRLMQLAKQKGWPLTIQLKKGHQAFLYGVSPKGMPQYISTNENIISAATIGTSQLWPGGSTGLNLSGSTPDLKGRLALWDGGRVLGTHQELVNRIVQVDNPADLSDHSTHVSGTLIASGVNPVARGMSFGAPQLNAYDFNNQITEMFAAAPKLLISNHSYGEISGWNYNSDKSRWEFSGDPGDTADYRFGYYDDITQQWDSMAYNAPNYLIVKSAGNNRDVNGPAVGQPYYRYNANGQMAAAGNRPAGISSNNGYDIIPTYGNAKNIISIGAVNPIPGGYNKPADVVLSDFSSWGPSDDGRIKPDLVADGVDVLSSVSTSNNAYAIFSGTSMSSPAAAGSAFLLQEYFYKLNNSTYMRSATLKGILIHTADEAGPSDGPDYQYGWGLIDMPKAAAVITSKNTDQLIQENNLTDASGTYTFQVVASGKGPLTATICWTDPPAAVNEVFILNNPERKLVNDLDLRITGNGNTYMPWVLNRLIPWNPATHGDDTLNNVEKITIPNTIPGTTYTITVSHKGNLRTGAQAYSLLVSGVGSSAYCASSSLSATGTRINQVTLGNLNFTNPTACVSYRNNTDQTVSLQASQSYPVSINLASCDGSTANRVVKIFIDYNNNGTFTDPGETAVVSAVLPGGVYTFTGTLQVPAGMQIGNITRMRIVAQETTDTSSVHACGTYSLGETDDFNITYIPAGNDVGMNDLLNPLPGTCQADSQRVSVRIKNSGSADQLNVPLHLKILSGSTVLTDISTVYPGTLPAESTVVYTFQPAIKTVTGASYIIQVSTSLPGDQNNSNDAITDTVLISAGSESITGDAEICSTSPPLAGLRANSLDHSDAVAWYDNPTATTPIATGEKASTTIIPSNKTYYMGLNEAVGSIGPKSKLDFPSGGYNYFQGNFVRIHNDVPVTLATARLYVGAGGKVNFIVADLSGYDSCTGSFSYFPISSTTIDVYPTTPNPSRVASSVNSPLDTGAVFLLNLPVPTPGDHVIIVLAEDSAFLFRNNLITQNPYPMGVPGIFTITGNSAINSSSCADTAFYQKYYYFFYDLQITLSKCPSPRVAVVAAAPTPATITLVGNVLKSNYKTGNQWYYGDSLIAGAAGQKDTLTLIGPGVYTDVVNDSIGCSLTATFNYSTSNDIGLNIFDNPNHGSFVLQFYSKTAANTELRILDMNGQQLYQESYPNFTGFYNKRIDLNPKSTGVYVLQLEIGGKKYVRKILILPL